MKSRYALYALSVAALAFLYVFSSYGMLLIASVVGITLLAASVATWVLVISLSERVAHRAVRIWNAVVPAHVTSMLFRQ